MGILIDKGLTHKIAEEVLKDNPENIEAKKILKKPKYSISINGRNLYFNSEAAMNSYINGARL